jgi:prophage antirepressor-like protein
MNECYIELSIPFYPLIKPVEEFLDNWPEKRMDKLLDIKYNRSALRILPDEWKGEQVLPTLGGNQNMAIINECGLYKIIMRSNNPNAEKFQEVVCEEILPSLRKKGEYKIQSIIDKNKELEEEKLKIEEEKNNLDAQNQISQKLIKDLNKKLERKQRTKYELSNSIYIISNKFFEGYFKIGKSSSFNNRLNSYSSGSPVEYKVEYICKVRNKCEETAVENMVLQILGVYRVKNHMDQDREWLQGVDLEIIKKEIDSCVNFISKSRDKYEKDPSVRRWVDMARRIEGTNKTFGVHAAGVVISARPLDELVLCCEGRKSTTIR